MKTSEHSKNTDFARLVKAASDFDPATLAVSDSGLASVSNGSAISEEFERRVMLRVARRAIEHSRRRARLSLVASLSGLAMLCAACIAFFVSWSPAFLPHTLGAPFEKFAKWAANLNFTVFDEFGKMWKLSPFLGDWGGVLMITLILGGATGFVYYLSRLFNENL